MPLRNRKRRLPLSIPNGAHREPPHSMVASALSHPIIQARLRVGAPNDRFEQEADLVAERVMRMPDPENAPALPAGIADDAVQRKCAACSNGSHLCPECAEEEEKVRRKPGDPQLLQARESPGAVPRMSPGVEARIRGFQGGGRPLPQGERAFFESRLGADFSRIRIHTNTPAAETAAAIQARAFTAGSDIVFGAGEYQGEPTSRSRELLAHELVHVIQQGAARGGVAPGVIQRRKPPAAVPTQLFSPILAGDAILEDVINDRSELRQGSKGDAVRRVQEALLSEGYPLPKFGADGIFGPETAKAVRMFQQRWRLDVDSIVGDQTLGLLDSQLFNKGVLQFGEERGGLIGGVAKRLATAGLDIREADFARTDCPAANKAERLTACIQPVVVAEDDGSNPTAPPPFEVAQRIWEKCCINYSVLPNQTVNKTDFKVLDESPNNTPTAEETALFTAAGASRCIQVFVPETFEQGGVISKAISGGGATYDGGAANAKVVVVEGTVSEVVAHELGHATGFGGHDGNPTVMKPTGAHNVPNSTAVSKDVCTRARTGGTLATTGGTADCCMDPR
ncbi:MAG: DUF4157 domain-containing protein [Terrimicrobiaceae bacterium]